MRLNSTFNNNQKPLFMIKHLRFFVLNLLVLVCAAVWAQADVVYKTLTFPDDNSSKNGVQNYTSTWTAQHDDDTWTIENFNNNKWGSSWTYIKCGSKSGASVGTIVNDAAYDVPVTKVVVDIKSANTQYVNSIKLIVAKDQEGTDVVETIGADYEAGTTIQGDLQFAISAPAAGLFYKLVFDCPKQKSNGMVSINSVSYYYGTSATKTALSFGESVDNKKFIVRQGDTFEAKTAQVTPTDAVGTITYSSNAENVVAVDPQTGALTFGELGDATITAHFTAGEGYVNSEASYDISYRRAANPKTVLFDSNEETAFASIAEPANQYKQGDFSFVDVNGDSYTFTVNNAMVNSYNKCLQLKKASASDETTQGYVVSPTFDKFEYGYRVIVNYLSENGAPELESVNYPTEVASVDDANGTVYMDVPYADGIFKLLAGNVVTYISSIELIPLDKPAEPTTLTFPKEEYNIYLDDEFEAPKATLTNELGNELSDLDITYLSSDEDVATVDKSTGAVTVKTVGTVNIMAYFWGNSDYAYSEASYTLNVTARPEKQEPGFYYEEPKFSTSVTSVLTTKDMWFRNPNNIAVKFESSDEEVGVVSEDGTVRFKKAGEVTIRAYFDGDDNYKAGESSCTIVVTDMRNESLISFSEQEYTVNLPEANGWFCDADLYNPYNLTDLVFTSSNTDVAEVGEVPNTVKLISAGETTITVEFAGDNYYKPGKASYRLIVTNNPVDAINSISIDNVPADAKVFNLQGQSVNAKNLKKGIYVVNGKKVVVRK